MGSQGIAQAELDAVYPARPACVGRIRQEVADTASGCGAAQETIEKIKLAVSEAVTNAVIHAYRDGHAAGDLRVLVRQSDAWLDISIRDSGVGMSPRTDSPGVGLGLALMSSLADCFEIKAPPEGGTEIVLRFEMAAQSTTRDSATPFR